jgi:hypothetical protein
MVFKNSICGQRRILADFMKCILVLFIPVFLSGCEDEMDLSVNCILDTEPAFSTESLPDAILNQEYSASIVAHMENGFDDEYEYEFTLEEGRLPEGLKLVNWREELEHWYDWASNEEMRTVKIKGTPTEIGEYEFKLEVYVTAKEGLTNLCNQIDERYYTITVKSE